MIHFAQHGPGRFSLYVVRMIGTRDIVGFFAAESLGQLFDAIDECVSPSETEWREIDGLGVFWPAPAFPIPDKRDCDLFDTRILEGAEVSAWTLDAIWTDGPWVKMADAL